MVQEAIDGLTDQQIADLELQESGLVSGQNADAIAYTPFAQRMNPRPAPAPEPEEPVALSEFQLNQLEEENYRRMDYVMTPQEFDQYWDRRDKEDREVGRFFEGLGQGAAGLIGMVPETGRELQGAMVGMVTDPVNQVQRNVQTGAEIIRKGGINLVQLFDWVGSKVDDLATGSKRAEAINAGIMDRLIADGKMTGNREQDEQIYQAALGEAREAGAYTPTLDQAREDKGKAYERYVREKALERDFANVSEFRTGEGQMSVPTSAGTYQITDEQPMPTISTLGSMVVDPLNALPLGAGALSKARVLRRIANLSEKPLQGAERVASGLADVAERVELGISTRLQDITGLTQKQQAALGAGVAGTAVYVDSATDGGGGITKAVLMAGAVMPALHYGGGLLRKVGSAAGGAATIVREAGVGGLGVARAEAASSLAGNAAVPERYRKFFTGYVDGTDSTLKRVAQESGNPEALRRMSRFADRMGATQVARAADDVVSGAVTAGIVGSPFAALQPDAERAGEVMGGILALGGVGGLAGGVARRAGTAADADIARMFADVQAVGGNVEAFARLPHATLDRLSAMQGVLAGKVDFVPLTGDEYRMNADIAQNGGEATAGVFLDRDANNRARVFINLDGKTATDAIAPHEIGHAILTSNILDGQPRNDLRNLVNQQYGPEGVEARGREYIARMVDADLRQGATGEAPTVLTEAEMKAMDGGKTMDDIVAERAKDPAERDRLINERVEEFRQRSIDKGEDALDWARDEIIAETFASEAPAIDFRAIRRDALFPRLAESMLSAGGRVLEVMGARLDPGTGKLMDSPSVLFRDNPLFQDRIMQKRVREYVRSYDQYLAGLEEAGAKELRGVELARSSKPDDLARSTHVKLRDEGNGVLENDFLFQKPDGTYSLKPQKIITATENARSAQIKTLYDARKFVPVNSQEFGKRKVNGREVVGGPVLPPQFDFFTHFPQHVREFARSMEQSRAEGGSWDIDYNAIGTGASGRYRVTNLGNVRAIQRETVPFGWQVTKANHLLAASLDLNSFRGSAMKAINKGDLGLFNNDMRQVEADLKTYLANHRNGRPGEMTIGQQKRDMLNGLIGTGTAVQRTANPLYSDLNPRGSIRTWRVDRLNDAKPTGRTGYFFDYDKINNNRMPSALPQAGMAMPDVAVVPERFTGTGQEPNRQSRFAQPPPFFARFPIESYERGGKFFDAQSGEDLTGRSYGAGFIDVSSGKPRLFVDGDPAAQPAKSGRTYRTNLFKQKAGWKWISDNAPATSTIVSVEGGGRHVYALRADFEGGVDLARYSDKPSEPRLRPTARGELSLGNEVGRISIRGKEHSVYDGARIAQQDVPRGQAMPDTPANLSTDQILRELEENQGYLGLSTLGMREGRPVKGGAQQTRELLKRNTALNEELKRRGGPQEESDVERVLRQRGQAMPDVDVQWETYAENLRDDVESWSPARDTGRIDYEMQDVVDSFVDFARTNPQMAGGELTAAFYRAEKPTASQRKKLNAAIANVGEPPRVATGGTRGQAMPDVDARHADLEARYRAGDQGALRQAQTIADDAAKTQGYKVGPVHHWTPEQDFSVFDINKGREGFHFGTKQAAEDRSMYRPGRTIRAFLKGDRAPVRDMMTNNARELFRQLEREGRIKRKVETDYRGATEGVYNEQLVRAADEKWMLQNQDSLRGTRQALSAENERNYRQSVAEVEAKLGRPLRHPMQELQDMLGSEYTVFEYPNKAEDKGSMSYAVTRPEQVKSAEPFTYDDSGRLIPMSRRFDASRPDVRFMPDVGDAEAVGLRSAKFLEEAVGDGMENLRAKQAKREGTGVAKNKFVRFHDNQGRPIYIGAIKKDGGKSFAGWIEETEAWQSPAETAAYRQWYRELKGYFTKIFGDRAGEMMMAWLAAQQNVSPGGALGNVFKVEDRLAGIGTGKKGGLADAKIEGVLRSEVPEGGFGPKLTDFVDAGFLREYRTYMAKQPAGGRPFVADVHTGRDSGHVDQQTLTRLKQRSDEGDLFIDGKPTRVKVLDTKTVKQGSKTVIVPERIRVIPQGSKGFDVGVDMRGSPGGPKYEGISEWGNAMTDHLNNIGWRDGEWTPAEVQAVGWMRVLRQYGLPEPTVLSALQQNTSRVFAEVNYSSGNLLPANYPSFDTLSPDVQRAITTDVITQTVNELAPLIGGSLRVQRVTAGTGVWGNTRSPTTVVEVLGSAEATDIFGLALATASEQAATMSTVLGVGGKDSRVLMFKKAGGAKFSEAEMQSLIDDAGVSGYTLQQLPDGDTGIIADSTKDFKPKGFTEKKIADVKKKLVDWAEKSGVDIDVEIASARVNSYANNWNNAKDGQSYLSGIVQRGGSSKIRDIVRFRGRYAEILREAYERHAPEAVVATPQEQIGPIRQAAEAPPLEILEMLRGA